VRQGAEPYITHWSLHLLVYVHMRRKSGSSGQQPTSGLHRVLYPRRTELDSENKSLRRAYYPSPETVFVNRRVLDSRTPNLPRGHSSASSLDPFAMKKSLWYHSLSYHAYLNRLKDTLASNLKLGFLLSPLEAVIISPVEDVDAGNDSRRRC